jgi:predicted XRE-type DNA-binding protein
MHQINKQLNERVAIGRVGEKYSWFNMPDIAQIDKEIRKMAHVWILVTRRGRARVYKLQHNPFENQTYPEAICEVDWAKIPTSDPAMKKLNEAKWDKLEGEEGTKHVPIDEHREAIRKAEEQAEREARNDYIIKAVERDLLPQSELAKIFDVSQSTVSNVWQDYKDSQTEAAS